MDKEAVIHFVAGAAGGTAGTACTCPLEVVKVRLQSSLYTAGPTDNGTGSRQPSTSSATQHMPATNRSANDSRMQSWKVRRPSVYAPIIDRALDTMARGRGAVACCQPNRIPVLHCAVACCSTQSTTTAVPPNRLRLHRLLFYHFRDMVRLEGPSALFRGLVPNIIGVAPSKAVYFYTYSSSKRLLNDFFVPNTPVVHMCSAAVGGFVAASFINPVWLVKTRLQLDRQTGTERLTVARCIRIVYKSDGLKGFYRGVTASYAGIAETIIQFVLYEYFRSVVFDRIQRYYGTESTTWSDDGENGDTSPAADSNASSNNGSAGAHVKALVFMMCGGVSKLFATTAAYPHEVARTRLREPGNKYTGLFQCWRLVVREEGVAALYRGLFVHLLRTVPNTAITMATYELVLHVLLPG